MSMQRPTLTIFFQLDPWNPTIGGIQTCISYVLKYAPEEFDIRLVGISSDRKRLGQWHQAELHGRTFQFMPLLYIEDDDTRQLIPTTLKYAWALRNRTFESDFFLFYRIEPTVMTRQWNGHKILHIQNDIFQEVKGNANGGILWKRFPWAYFALEKRLVAQFDRIISCNSNSAQNYRDAYPDIAERVSYLPNTFDGDLFYPLSDQNRHTGQLALARQLGLADGTRFILFAGRLHPQKDPSLLVRAMAAVKHPDAHLLIVGKGELKDSIVAELARLGISDRATLLGAVKQTKLADLYRVCEMYVLTSAYEGLAFGSLEALACGTPVVTTQAGELPSFLAPDSGIVCEQREPDAIAAAWDRVLQQRSAFPSAACVRVANPYQAKQVVQSFYSELLTEWQSANLEKVPA